MYKIVVTTQSNLLGHTEKNSLFELTWPQNSRVGQAGDNLTKNFNYKCLVFLCKLVVFQLSRGWYSVVA